MLAAHHSTNGDGREEFIEWSTSDPQYANDGDLIGRRWDSLLADADALEESLVVHVRDLASGEIGVFSGTREIVLHDPDLAGRLFRTTR
jgi:hypothetical protein